MTIIPIRLRGDGSGEAGLYIFPSELATDASVKIDVRVFEGGSSADSYFSQDEEHQWYVVLHGGTAYATARGWGAKRGDVHQLEYDCDFNVVHYWNCNWTVSSPMLHFDQQPDTDVVKLRSTIQHAISSISKSSQVTARVSAEGFKRLAVLAEQVSNTLLPELIRENRETRRLVECLLQRIDDNLALIGLSDPDKAASVRDLKGRSEH